MFWKKTAFSLCSATDNCCNRLLLLLLLLLLFISCRWVVSSDATIFWRKANIKKYLFSVRAHHLNATFCRVCDNPTFGYDNGWSWTYKLYRHYYILSRERILAVLWFSRVFMCFHIIDYLFHSRVACVSLQSITRQEGPASIQREQVVLRRLH